MHRLRGFASPLAAVALCLAFAPPAFADTFRCGSSLIAPGATAGFVQQKCGPPGSMQVVNEPVRSRRENGTSYETGAVITHEIWRYTRGTRQFPALLTFEGGVLKKLEFEK